MAVRKKYFTFAKKIMRRTKPFLVLFSLFIFNSILLCQGGMHQSFGARLQALGGNGENFKDANALFYNQAGIAYLDQHTIILGIENRFFVPGLTQIGFGYLLPTKSGNFGLQTLHYGNEFYKESKFGLSYARLLSENFSIGTQINYMLFQVQEGGSEGVFNFEIGIQQKIFEYLEMGLHVFGPIQSSLSNGYKLPSIFRLGALIKLAQKVHLLIGADKVITQKENLKLGIEYYINPSIPFRIGMQTFPQSITFGFGAPISSGMKVDFASEWNPILGISPSCAIVYNFHK
jgi:hypothetical protein